MTPEQTEALKAHMDHENAVHRAKKAPHGLKQRRAVEVMQACHAALRATIEAMRAAGD